MADGLRNKLKIGAVIQARMGSTRMPGKILLPLPFPNGKPMLSCIIHSLRTSHVVNNIYVATSLDESNKAIEELAVQNEVQCFRGSENDVLSRFIDVKHQHHLDVIVRITADNPILDTSLLDEVINRHIELRNDYTYTQGLPVGMNFEVVSGDALTRQAEYNLSADDREHVTLYLKTSNLFKVECMILNDDTSVAELRLTADYPADFLMLSVIFSMLKPGETPNFDFVKRLYKSHPWIFEANKLMYQKRAFSTMEHELREASLHLRSIGMERTANLIDGKIRI